MKLHTNQKFLMASVPFLILLRAKTSNRHASSSPLRKSVDPTRPPCHQTHLKAKRLFWAYWDPPWCDCNTQNLCDWISYWSHSKKPANFAKASETAKQFFMEMFCISSLHLQDQFWQLLNLIILVAVKKETFRNRMMSPASFWSKSAIHDREDYKTFAKDTRIL